MKKIYPFVYSVASVKERFEVDMHFYFRPQWLVAKQKNPSFLKK